MRVFTFRKIHHDYTINFLCVCCSLAFRKRDFEHCQCWWFLPGWLFTNLYPKWNKKRPLSRVSALMVYPSYCDGWVWFVGNFTIVTPLITIVYAVAWHIDEWLRFGQRHDVNLAPVRSILYEKPEWNNWWLRNSATILKSGRNEW